jgi:outer membrane protein insertion porin family
MGLLLLGIAAGATAGVGQVDALEVEGNEFMSDEAVITISDVNVGDAYDEKALSRELLKLWDSGLFEDVRIESAPSPSGGKVVIFVVREKPRIESVTIEQVKAVGRDRIDDALKDNDADIQPNTPLDQERVSRARRLIEELLAVEGFPDARVTVVQRRVARSRVSLDFRIDPGAKIKIDEIDFTGNSLFSDKQLKNALKNTKESGLFSALSSKSVYYLPKFREDLEGVKGLYRSRGYLDVEIGEPVTRDSKPAKSGKQEKRFVKLEVPVTEGRPYRLGKLSISGHTVYPTAELRPLIPLAEGEVLNDSLLRLGLTRIDNRYGDNGYLYASSAPRYTQDKARGVADVDVQITEGAAYTVRRIEFDGNVRTKDEVLRREMRLSEGDLFSRRDFLLSTRKIAQLGFWELQGDPTITPVPGENQVDIKVRGNEVGRNEIQFGGGFSGTDGFFATFSFFSRNFLGRGAQFSISGQVGGDTTRYALTYVEPYFLRTKSSLGGSLFARDQQFNDFDRQGTGATVFWGYPTSTFSSFRVTGAWENSKITGLGNGVEDDEFNTFKITPSLAFDNRDNPLRPTRGRRFNLDLEMGASKDKAPDPLLVNTPFQQDTVTFVKPEAGYTNFWRTTKKHYFGVHVEGGILEPLSGGAEDQRPLDGIDTPYLPVFERYFLGGERSIRSVQTRSVGPQMTQFRDDTLPVGNVQMPVPPHALPTDCNNDGDTDDVEFEEFAGGTCRHVVDEVSVGGDAYWLMNLEYSIPFSNIFEATLFMDVGNAFGVNHLDIKTVFNLQNLDEFETQDSNPFDVKATAGLELRFHTPVLQQPLRLIYGCKVLGDFTDDQNTCSFQFSIGRTFQ